MGEHTPTLDIRSFSQSTKDSRCLEVWFAKNITDADRAALLKAVNNHAALVEHLRRLAVRCCDDDAFALIDELDAGPDLHGEGG